MPLAQRLDALPQSSKEFAFEFSVFGQQCSCTAFRSELATVYLDRGIISANPHMNALQEHASPYPPFESMPMPANAREAHFILMLVIIIWAVGFALVLRMGKQSK